MNKEDEQIATKVHEFQKCNKINNEILSSLIRWLNFGDPSIINNQNDDQEDNQEDDQEGENKE